MRITITGKHRNLSESLKSYIEDKVSELTRHYEQIIDAHVILDMEKKIHVVEIILHVARQNFHTKTSSSNLRVAIDACAEKLVKQLVKRKSKVRRKALKPEEAVLSGKVFPSATRESDQPTGENTILTLETEETASLNEENEPDRKRKTS